ncbi:hypothetical protein [Sphingobacterium faecale]|uniref:Uncharacterized protein n=1 Tax=Sphingobacterium faecale TaxID=2803775 RepID=A0ABS1R7H2_9SPHI|nr:hypothetical protein [Sphingobacterium faecale]MBL1410215.1 hypothetical protein [Sphingobacterium faecale]
MNKEANKSRLCNLCSSRHALLPKRFPRSPWLFPNPSTGNPCLLQDVLPWDGSVTAFDSICYKVVFKYCLLIAGFFLLLTGSKTALAYLAVEVDIVYTNPHILHYLQRIPVFSMDSSAGDLGAALTLWRDWSNK